MHLMRSTARRVRASVWITTLALVAPRTTSAQHEGHVMTGGAMSMAGPLGISMERMGSGTTWIPDAVKLPSRDFMIGSPGLMCMVVLLM